MTSMPGSVICASPRTPCAGDGCCDVDLSPIGSPLAVPVILKTTTGSDFSIVFQPPALASLSTLRPDIWNSLTQLKVFPLDQGALPFYLNKNVANALYNNSVTNMSIDPGTQCQVSSVGTGPDMTVTVTFNNINKNSPIQQTGIVGQIIAPINPAMYCDTWAIGVDVYNNLIFFNDNNLIMFGCNGNASVNRYSVSYSNSTRYDPYPLGHGTGTQIAGGWQFGMCAEMDNLLCFSNSNNSVCFPYGIGGMQMMLAGWNVITTSQADFTPGTPSTTTKIYKCGNPGPQYSWSIFADTVGNLCFSSAEAFYYFGVNGGIYFGDNLGQNAQMVTTSNPGPITN